LSILDNLQKKYGKSLLNKKEVSAELNISQATLDRLRKTGEIKSKKSWWWSFLHYQRDFFIFRVLVLWKRY
jgi:hypothetical protein